MDGTTLIGSLLGVVIGGLLYVAAWESGKKRKIGLTLMSFLTLLITPFFAFIVSLFTKRIDKTKDELSYEQRLPYENTTAMLIAAILYFAIALVSAIATISNAAMGNGQSTGRILIICIIHIIWGCSLLKQRKMLMMAKNTSA